MNRQVPLFSIRMKKVEHDGSYNEESEAAHLQETLISVLGWVGFWVSTKKKQQTDQLEQCSTEVRLTVLKDSTMCSECL